MQTRQKHSNTESELETFNNKKLCREMRKKKLDDEYDLNGMLSLPAKVTSKEIFIIKL